MQLHLIQFNVDPSQRQDVYWIDMTSACKHLAEMFWLVTIWVSLLSSQIKCPSSRIIWTDKSFNKDLDPSHILLQITFKSIRQMLSSSPSLTITVQVMNFSLKSSLQIFQSSSLQVNSYLITALHYVGLWAWETIEECSTLL